MLPIDKRVIDSNLKVGFFGCLGIVYGRALIVLRPAVHRLGHR